MAHLPRRSFLALAPVALLPDLIRAAEKGKTVEDTPAKKRLLPMSTIFKGEAKFAALVKRAQTEGWATLPIGERVAKFGQGLLGVPYVNFTLEIDDHTESPSVNLTALDCWSFFEQSLGLARMIGFEKPSYTPDDLLRQIEFTRYRGGVCTGNYLERIHYLAEWFFENDARGSARHITNDLPGATRITGRKVSEMTTLWKSYRYLRNNPELRAPMKETEDMVAKLPVYHIPKAKVAGIESKLQSGDVIGIATKYNGAFCSHVGLALKNKDGEMRFMHASRNYKKVVVDKTISGYLNDFSAHAGILVGRPLEVSETVTDKSAYEANLKKLLS